ncbi:hypothetical protein OPU71_03595 [Niveibacterium sp. 24ML]|uniref:hypothetical protein n=1 Tax=Niveibacterium sp. 24ML TaxID=2985512 RepID=UPI00226F1EA5|nr:hypothetical protein [Niveibacterium sp. 24ML]MCX9155202.1 hypothetical protein [Niveibacterium sp. 24ML]
MTQTKHLAREIDRTATRLRNAGLTIHCDHAEPWVELGAGRDTLILRQAHARAVLMRAAALWRAADTVSFDDALLHACAPAAIDLKQIASIARSS